MLKCGRVTLILILESILEHLVFTYLGCGVEELLVDWTRRDSLGEVEQSILLVKRLCDCLSIVKGLLSYRKEVECRCLLGQLSLLCFITIEEKCRKTWAILILSLVLLLHSYRCKRVNILLGHLVSQRPLEHLICTVVIDHLSISYLCKAGSIILSLCPHLDIQGVSRQS